MAKRFMTYNTEDATPNRQLVTNGNGEWVTAERLAWKEESVEEIFPEQTLEFAEFDDSGYACELDPAVFNLKIGEKNIVVWDGTKYECVAKDDGDGNACIGNLSIIGGQVETDEPFFIVSVANEFNFFQTLSSSKSHTISITRIVENIHTIPEKYLPATDSKTPIVNVTLSDDGATYTADKTYEEILSMLAEGVFPVCVVNRFLVLPLTASSELSAVMPLISLPWHHFSAYKDGKVYDVKLYSDEAVDYIENDIL